jgi:hypothetical protein
MTPTAKLRFVMPDVPDGLLTVRILQQWWDYTEVEQYEMYPNVKAGAWRDVPLEEET